jgi:hypothetical protein
VVKGRQIALQLCLELGANRESAAIAQPSWYELTEPTIFPTWFDVTLEFCRIADPSVLVEKKKLGG